MSKLPSSHSDLNFWLLNTIKEPSEHVAPASYAIDAFNQ